jgi:hypothetical protein
VGYINGIQSEIILLQIKLGNQKKKKKKKEDNLLISWGKRN